MKPEINFKKIIESIDSTDLTDKDITVKFIRENFKKIIDDFMLLFDLNFEDIEKDRIRNLIIHPKGPDKINEKFINIDKIFMGQELPTEIWIGMVTKIMDKKFIKTVRSPSGILFQIYDKEKELTDLEKIVPFLEKLEEKEFVQILKKELKIKVKNEKS